MGQPKVIQVTRASWEGFGSSHQLPAKRLVGVTLGNFDGVHLGHQALFSALKTRLLEKKRELEQRQESAEPYAVLFTFHPHPRVVLARQKGIASEEQLTITDLRSKVELAGRFGIDLCVSAHFTTRFAALSPEEFVTRFLVHGLQSRVVVVGHDWAFGRGRSGGVEELAELGERFNFSLSVLPPVEIDGIRVSTTAVREALGAGDIATACRLLGRRYVLSERVRRGESRGAGLGFPTANLEFPGRFLPADGVYAGRAMIREREFPAVANLGVRPTFGGGRRILEVHLLLEDAKCVFQPHLCGERLAFEFVARVREERRFDGPDQLRKQIANDIEKARHILGERG